MGRSRSLLPGGLGHSGHVALVCGVAEADPAQAELPVVSARPAAAAATVLLARLVLRLLADDLRSLCHRWLLLASFFVRIFRAGGLGVAAALALFALFVGLLGLGIGLGVLFLELLERC